MNKSVLVLNPNSTVAVTDGIDQALHPLRMTGGPTIDCETLTAGPPAIETREHVETVIDPMCEHFEASSADAFVIACYSDPGLDAARQRLDKPVFGMAESGMLVAMSRGQRFGVISVLQQAVERHLQYVDKLGLSARLAADLPVSLGVLELADKTKAWPRLQQVGSALRDQHAADSILLGCAGMAPYRERLQSTLGIPVIDPTQAAVTLAIGAVSLIVETSALPA